MARPERPRRPGRRRRRAPAGLFSLRFKLTLWYLAVFALIQVTLVVAVVTLRHDMIKRTFDAALRQRAEALIERLVASPPPWNGEVLRRIAAADPRIALCAVRNEGGEIVAASINHDLRSLPDADAGALHDAGGRAVFTTLDVERGRTLTGTEQALRVVTLPFKDRYGTAVALQAATRAEFLDQWMGPFLDLFLLGIPIGLVAACIPVWLIARRATAPIRQASEAARQVTPASPGWGIHLAGRDPEVVKLEIALNGALERLEAGFRAQERFVDNVSHELRTPITVLLTQAQVLKVGQPDPAECLRFVASVEEEMRRLGRLVESILELVRAGMGRGVLRQHPICINDLVLQAVHLASPLARRQGVRVMPDLVAGGPDDDRAVLVGDPDLLCTMLDNLVRNAIRFSPPGAAVEVSGRQADDEAILTVRDRGPGIPAAYLRRVFERFVQVPAGGNGHAGPAARQERGTGLGLAIARDVATLHHGTITAWNRGHGGCAFRVRLPLTPATAAS